MSCHHQNFYLISEREQGFPHPYKERHTPYISELQNTEYGIPAADGHYVSVLLVCLKCEGQHTASSAKSQHGPRAQPLSQGRSRADWEIAPLTKGDTL